jgi:hypothetical protein
MKTKDYTWVLITAIVAIYLAAAIVEPCDGHSCTAETIDGR